MLPHEVLNAIAAMSDEEALLCMEGLSADARAHWRHVATQLGTERLLGVGLWGDGTPCNWDRTESVEIFSLNLPGLVGHEGQLRIPIVAIKKKTS